MHLPKPQALFYTQSGLQGPPRPSDQSCAFDRVRFRQMHRRALEANICCQKCVEAHSRGSMRLAFRRQRGSVSTWGLPPVVFTQVLLERGATKIFCGGCRPCPASFFLRENPASYRWKPRMHVRFRTGVSMLRSKAVTCDVSFISLVKVLPSVFLFPAKRLAGRPGETPFRVGRAHIGKGGIVKNETAKSGGGGIASQLI